MHHPQFEKRPNNLQSTHKRDKPTIIALLLRHEHIVQQQHHLALASFPKNPTKTSWIAIHCTPRRTHFAEEPTPDTRTRQEDQTGSDSTKLSTRPSDTYQTNFQLLEQTIKRPQKALGSSEKIASDRLTSTKQQLFWIDKQSRCKAIVGLAPITSIS